jgi:alpha-glucosidase
MFKIDQQAIACAKRYLLFWLPLILVAGLGASLRAQRPDSLAVTSPNGKLRFAFALWANGVPSYQIDYQQQPVILPSRLGLLRNENGFWWMPNWDAGFQVDSVRTGQQRATWRPVWGERDICPDHYNELTVSLSDGKGKSLQIMARAYDEGIAFRYYFPESLNTQIVEIGQEGTHFKLPPATQAWVAANAQGEYQPRLVDTWERPAELPLTLKMASGLWACLTHAGATDHPRMRLVAQGGELVSRLHGDHTDTSPFGTPWRVVMVAEAPGQLMERNYLIMNLNPPSALANPAWIKPGRVMREVTLSTSGAKALVDFAVEQNIDFIHFDAGWYGHEYEVASDARRAEVDPRCNPKRDLDLPQAIAYARSKGKKVILYVNHRALERQLDELLPLYQSWGVAGIKFGFVHTGSHRWTAWLHEAVKKAARYQLMVNIHDEYMPTGFSRTYPNLMTQEGVRGNEEFPSATHNTILPFTRMVQGAADYTFCFNVETIRPGKVRTSKVHQLALPVIYFSPWQYLYWYGQPKHFPDRGEIAFWKTLPTTWDDTRVVAGTPGEYVAVARRKGNEWYIGLITNDSARSIALPLDFLAAGKTYRAELYEDQPGNRVGVREQKVTRQDRLEFSLMPAGGVAIRLVEQR